MSIKLTTERNSLPQLPAMLERGASMLTQKSATDAANHARTNIVDMSAVDEGELLGSVSDEGNRTTVSAPHAQWVNDGTSRMAARPFWDQTLATMEGEFAGGAEKLLKGLA